MTWEKDLITYRREKAAETLEDAKILWERQSIHSYPPFPLHRYSLITAMFSSNIVRL